MLTDKMSLVNKQVTFHPLTSKMLYVALDWVAHIAPWMLGCYDMHRCNSNAITYCPWYKFRWIVGNDQIEAPSKIIRPLAVSSSPRPWIDVFVFPEKIQHGGDWERSRPQGPKNVHSFLMTVRSLSWACGHRTEMLLILKKIIFNLIMPRYFPIWQSKEMSHDIVRGQSVAETCFSH